MAMDVYYGDVEGTRIKGQQLAQNGRAITEAAAGLHKRIETAFIDVDDEALRTFRTESLEPYCAALAEIGRTCTALGDAAIKIVNRAVQTDQEAAAAIRRGVAGF